MTNVSFVEPNMLWLLLAPPLLFALFAVFADRKSLSRSSHSSIALLLLGFTFAGFAAAQPALVSLRHPAEVVFVLDVSGGMRADDVAPSRMAAAQDLARSVISQLSERTRIGIVAFGAEAEVAEPLTTQRGDLEAAIDRLAYRRGTNIVAGLSLAMDMIQVRPSRDAALILISDGIPTAGPNPVISARSAAERGVRIFTVTVGTPSGSVIGYKGPIAVRTDDRTLTEIAQNTGAEHFAMTSVDAGPEIARRLPVTLMDEQLTTLWLVFAALAALSFTGAAGAEGYRRGAATTHSRSAISVSH